jgi:hypothetical protein
MAHRRSPRRRAEILARTITVDSVSTSLWVSAEKPRGLPARFRSHPWIELRGETEEPVRDVRQFVVSLHVDDSTEPGPVSPPPVGAILTIRPEIQAVVGMNQADFDRAWAMAVSGQLRNCHLAFTEPVRRSPLIVSASISSQ